MSRAFLGKLTGSLVAGLLFAMGQTAGFFVWLLIIFLQHPFYPYQVILTEDGPLRESVYAAKCCYLRDSHSTLASPDFYRLFVASVCLFLLGTFLTCGRMKLTAGRVILVFLIGVVAAVCVCFDGRPLLYGVYAPRLRFLWDSLGVGFALGCAAGYFLLSARNAGKPPPLPPEKGG